MVNTWPGWESVGLLGEGSFGKVYRIQREEFGQTYEAALKVITIPASQGDVRAAYEEGMDEESVTEYFRGFVEDIVAEFALMSRLKGNSNIVSYEDHMVVQHEGEVGWDILIRMELLTALSDYIIRHPLEEADVVRLGLDLAQALQLCRKRGIIHRDIKPENIFVSKDGDFKLGDFGVARIAEKTISAMSRKGTYNYMAPEVYKGQEYGYTADIYSLGLVLYRFLNDNRVPFLPPYPRKIQYSDREGALNERMSGRQIPFPAHGDRELAEIVLKCCAFRPQDRYQDAGWLEADLRRLVPGSVTSAPVETVYNGNRSIGSEAAENNSTLGGWRESGPEASDRNRKESGQRTSREESGQGISGAGWKESGREDDRREREESGPESTGRKQEIAGPESIGREQEIVGPESTGREQEIAGPEEVLDKTLSAFSGRRPVAGKGGYDDARDPGSGEEGAGAAGGNAETGASGGSASQPAQKPAGKQLLAMMLPFVLGGLCWQIHIAADVWMIEPYGSSISVGVSLAIGLAGLISSLLAWVVLGGSAVLARYQKVRDGRNVLDSVRTMLVLAGVAGILMSLAGFILSPLALRSIQDAVEIEIWSYAIVYLRILSLGFIPAAIFYGCVGILRTLDGGWRPLLLVASGAVLKVILNVLYMTMVRNGAWTIQQALAGSTVVVQLAGAVAASIAVHWAVKEYKATGGKGRFVPGQAKVMLRTGAPEGILWAVISLYMVLLLYQFLTFGYLRYDMPPVAGLFLAMNAFVWQNAGTMEKGRLRKNTWAGLARGIGAIIVLQTVVVFVRANAGIWTKGQVGYSLTLYEIRFQLPMFLMLAVVCGLSGVLRGAGLAKGPVVIAALCFGVAGTGWMLFFWKNPCGIMWLGHLIIWVLGAVALFLYAWKVDWPDHARRLWGGK